MLVVKLRPEHVPHILNIANVEEELREDFVRANYSGYSQAVFLNSLKLLNEHNIFEMVSGPDDICRLCNSPYQCKSNPMDLENTIGEFYLTDRTLAKALAYVSHVGKKYTFEQLKSIGKKFEEESLRF